MKTCRRCGISKAVEQFYADSRTPDGLRKWCKDCWNAYSRERWASGRTNRSKKATTDKAWRDANPDKVKLIGRRSNIKRKYGITLEHYETLLAAQSGRCAVCGSEDNGDRRFDTFSIDHDHLTGKIRGLLCAPCNRALGNVDDDPNRLMALAAYLLQHSDVLGLLGASV